MTPEAHARIAGMLAESLRGGELVVYGGSSTTAAVPLEAAVDGATVVVTGVFDERTANFHWRGRDVIAGDGTLIDRREEDLGEKVLGAVWTLEVPLEVAG